MEGIDFTTGFFSSSAREKESGMRRVPEICLAVGPELVVQEILFSRRRGRLDGFQLMMETAMKSTLNTTTKQAWPVVR